MIKGFSSKIMFMITDERESNGPSKSGVLGLWRLWI
jgi:hypothetical protein